MTPKQAQDFFKIIQKISSMTNANTVEMQTELTDLIQSISSDSAGQWREYQVDGDTTTLTIPAGYGVTAAAVKFDTAWTGTLPSITVKDNTDNFTILSAALIVPDTYFTLDFDTKWSQKINDSRDYLVTFNNADNEGSATVYVKLEKPF